MNAIDIRQPSPYQTDVTSLSRAAIDNAAYLVLRRRRQNAIIRYAKNRSSCEQIYGPCFDRSASGLDHQSSRRDGWCSWPQGYRWPRQACRSNRPWRDSRRGPEDSADAQGPPDEWLRGNIAHGSRCHGTRCNRRRRTISADRWVYWPHHDRRRHQAYHVPCCAAQHGT
jgi:hypothetical protein